MWVNWGKGAETPRTDYAHRKSVEPIRPQVSWNVCRKPTKMPTSLGVSLYCCCLIAWAVVHRNGGSFVFILSPNGSFSLIVLSSYFPDPLILSFAPVSGGPCHFKKNSLSPYSGKPVSDSTKTQYYLAVRSMVEKVLVCSCKAFGRWSYCPKKLENMDSGVRIQRHWLSCISTAGLIALFQTLAVLVVLWGLQVIGVFGISIHLPHLHSQLLPPENFDSKLLWCWPITELL